MLKNANDLYLFLSGHDDRSQDKSRNQLSSSSTATSGGGKIKKGKAEEVPKSTFENLFGPPIQNLTTSKHSPALNSSDSHKSQVKILNFMKICELELHY